MLDTYFREVNPQPSYLRPNFITCVASVPPQCFPTYHFHVRIACQNRLDFFWFQYYILHSVPPSMLPPQFVFFVVSYVFCCLVNLSQTPITHALPTIFSQK